MKPNLKQIFRKNQRTYYFRDHVMASVKFLEEVGIKYEGFNNCLLFSENSISLSYRFLRSIQMKSILGVSAYIDDKLLLKLTLVFKDGSTHETDFNKITSEGVSFPFKGSKENLSYFIVKTKKDENWKFHPSMTDDGMIVTIRSCLRQQALMSFKDPKKNNLFFLWGISLEKEEEIDKIEQWNPDSYTPLDFWYLWGLKEYKSFPRILYFNLETLWTLKRKVEKIKMMTKTKEHVVRREGLDHEVFEFSGKQTLEAMSQKDTSFYKLLFKTVWGLGKSFVKRNPLDFWNALYSLENP